GIMPVTMIDGIPVADGKVGAITKRLMAIYWQKHEDPVWSSPVRYP
ncbi:MAG: branched-chain amino acid transferase, partial [Mesorhizobium sp.]